MSKKTLVVLNGAPRSGKDSYANRLTDYTHRRFKDNLVDLALKMSGVSREDWEDRYEAYVYVNGSEPTRILHWRKDEPWYELGGLSQRQYLIWLSEEVIKPVHGKQVFGERLKADLDFESAMHDRNDFVTSDGGFDEEVQPFVDDPEWEVIVIKIKREGCTFEGDSRNYLTIKCDYELEFDGSGTIIEGLEVIEAFLNDIKEKE